VQLAAYSDQGPTRQRNEDACYPVSGTQQTWQSAAQQLSPKNAAPLVVVCDGIGGHQGGDVASKLAIEVVTQRLNPLLEKPNQPHATLVTALEQAILAANQEISAQNDQAQRQARDRMGTTIVIGLVYGARLYIAHLGDSRAYQVRPSGCRQITLDDDVAAREMRLGYSFYRDALLNPGSGSLVQALGMADSQYLHPMVQMQVVAEDGLWLICSDGLSDNDLVTRLWSSELLPVLTKGQSVGAMGQKLIQLANTYNGHDNVTVGLVRVSAKGRGGCIIVASGSRLGDGGGGGSGNRGRPAVNHLTACFLGTVPLSLACAHSASGLWGGGDRRRGGLPSGGRDTLFSGSTPTPESAEETGGTTLSPSAAPPGSPIYGQ
jgi:serine/threonine protein phosphatase PrpC